MQRVIKFFLVASFLVVQGLLAADVTASQRSEKDVLISTMLDKLVPRQSESERPYIKSMLEKYAISELKSVQYLMHDVASLERERIGQFTAREFILQRNSPMFRGLKSGRLIHELKEYIPSIETQAHCIGLNDLDRLQRMVRWAKIIIDENQRPAKNQQACPGLIKKIVVSVPAEYDNLLSNYLEDLLPGYDESTRISHVDALVEKLLNFLEISDRVLAVDANRVAWFGRIGVALTAIPSNDLARMVKIAPVIFDKNSHQQSDMAPINLLREITSRISTEDEDQFLKDIALVLQGKGVLDRIKLVKVKLGLIGDGR